MFPLRDNSIVGLSLLDNEPVKRPPVRRNLFGTPSPEKQSQDFLKQEIRCAENNGRDRLIKMYGFDVTTGKPVENSKFEWEIVDDAPSFYTKSYSVKPTISKFRPVHSPRRERSFNSPYSRHHIPPRHGKRGHHLISRTQEDAENDISSQLSSPSKQNTSSNFDHSSCSVFGFRNHSLSNSPNYPSSGLTESTPEGSLKQQTITDHFQVKKHRCHSKSLPRT